MAIFNRFPFFNAHELNLDWILRQLKDLLRRVKQLEESESGGGGDPGTTNYNDLSNKPKINNVTLQGNKSSTDLNIPTTTTIRAEINHAFQLYDPAKEDYDPPYAAGTLGYAIENAAVDPEDIQEAVDSYLDAHPAMTGMFTNAAKNSLITLLEKVAYIDGNGQQYLNDLITNLAATVTSISAVFTQGVAVIYDTDSLDTLKQYLVVTASYSDGTSSVVTGYTLSGTLTDGTSAITVSYEGKTDTFTVNVTAWDVNWSAESGSLPSGMTCTSVTWASGNEYADVMNPNYLIGDGVADIEVIIAIKTNPKPSYNTNTQLFITQSLQTSCKLYMANNASVFTFAGRTNGEQNSIQLTDVAINQFHKFKFHSDDGQVSLWIDDEFIGTRDIYNSQYNYGQIFYSVNTSGNNYTNKWALKAIRWRKLT